jgi:hypothetical protein
MTTRRSIRGSPSLGIRPEVADSSRGSPRVDGEPVNAPGVPGSLSFVNDAIWSPAETAAMEYLGTLMPALKDEKVVRSIQTLIAGSIQQALDKFSVFSQVKPFTNFEVINVPLAAGIVSPIDPPSTQVNRRLLFLVNPDAANAIWFNKNQSVAVNNGIPIAPNFGSIAVAMVEYVQHFAVCVGANNLITVWYS